MLPMPLARQPLLNLPVRTLQVLDDLPRDLVLLFLGERPAHPANEPEACRMPITTERRSSSALLHIAGTMERSVNGVNAREQESL
jgi:hypothetical protein